MKFVLALLALGFILPMKSEAAGRRHRDDNGLITQNTQVDNSPDGDGRETGYDDSCSIGLSGNYERYVPDDGYSDDSRDI